MVHMGACYWGFVLMSLHLGLHWGMLVAKMRKSLGITGTFVDSFWEILIPGLTMTIITGGVSMIIFFFVFKIIFPEGEAKRRSRSKIEDRKEQREAAFAASRIDFSLKNIISKEKLEEPEHTNHFSKDLHIPHNNGIHKVILRLQADHAFFFIESLDRRAILDQRYNHIAV